MCTVSFVPLKDGYCITSNRDERITRDKAIPPKNYVLNHKKIHFPKDPKAGGTWFAHDYKNCIVLLNGAEEKHIKKDIYRKSRGLIVIDLISAKNPLEEWNSIDLQDIEAFTIILYSNKNHVFKLQWNEIEKMTIELDSTKRYIWSSSTLYEKEIRNKRAIWFTDFLSSEALINSQKLLNFHKFTKSENKKYGLQINRNNLLKTVSITQCIITKNDVSFNYIDLLNK